MHRRGRLLFRVAYGLLRNAVAAEDVCQQAFLRAWEERSRIRAPDALGQWLVRTVTNLCLRIVRRRRIERRVLGRYAFDRQKGVRRHGYESEVREAVLSGLAKLPETTQVVVICRVMQGLSGDEVKDLIGCSASEVSRHLHRGLEQLRRLLPEFETELNG